LPFTRAMWVPRDLLAANKRESAQTRSTWR